MLQRMKKRRQQEQRLVVREQQKHWSMRQGLDCPDVVLIHQMACTVSWVQHNSDPCGYLVASRPLDPAEHRAMQGELFLG